MTRQHSCFLAIQKCWSFAPKMAWIVDEWHPKGARVDVTPLPNRYYTRATWPPRGRGRGESLYSPRRIEAKLRAMKAMELWAQGYTWEQIARATGYKDRSGPWKAVRRATLAGDYEEWKRKEARKWR